MTRPVNLQTHMITQRRPFYRDLTFQVVVAIVLGVLVGVLWPGIGNQLKPLGDIFIRLIQMVVGLIIFCTVTHGIASVRDLGKVGRIALKAMVYFEVVTSVALVIGTAPFFARLVENVLREIDRGVLGGDQCGGGGR